MRFIKRLQRINARTVELRAHEPLEQIRLHPVDALGQNHAAIVLVEPFQFRSQIALDHGRAGTRYRLPNSMAREINELKTLPVPRLPEGFVKAGRRRPAADDE